MSTSKNVSLLTQRLLELEDALEAKDRALFTEKLRECSGQLHNCSCGDSVLQQSYNSVLYRALEAFIPV